MRSGLASLLRSGRRRLRHDDAQPVVALVDGENQPIAHASQIDKAKPVGNKYRGIVRYNVTKDEVTVELCCVRRKAVACRVLNDSLRIGRTERKLRSRFGWDDDIRVEPAGSCI